MMQRLLLHPSDQPLFTVAVRSAGGAVALRINDVPVWREAGPGACQVELPVNEWLFQGENRWAVEFQAAAGDAGSAEAILEFRRLRQPHAAAVPLLTLHPCRGAGEWMAGGSVEAALPEAAGCLPGEAWELRHQAEPPAQRADGTLVHAASFHLPRPWPVCPWQEAASLGEQPNLKYSVRQLVHEYAGLLARRDLPALKRLWGERAAHLAAAYHLGEHEVDEALLVPRLLQSAHWQCSPLPVEEHWRLEVAGGGRLARLVEEATGESPLRLLYVQEPVEAVLEAWWAFTSRWSLLR